MKCALEACGHTVMVLTPQLQPYLFDADGIFRAERAERFFAVQKLDFVLVADGVNVAGTDRIPAETAFGVACIMREQAQRAGLADSDAGDYRPLDFALAFSSEALEGLSRLKKANVVRVHPLADRAYAHTPLACTIAFEPGILILQDETPARRSFAEKLRARCAAEGIAAPIRVAGAGWDGFERVGDTHAAYAYALRSSHALVLFGEAGNAKAADAAGAASGRQVVRLSGEEADEAAPVHDAVQPEAAELAGCAGGLVAFDNMVGLALADGVKVVSVGEVSSLHHRDRVVVCRDIAAAVDACLDGVGSDASGAGVASAQAASAAATARAVGPAQTASAATTARAAATAVATARAAATASAPARAATLPHPAAAFADVDQDMLEDVLDSAIGYAMAAFPKAGSPNPRAIACAFGYFGSGNFGDEYILETVDSQVRGIRPGASLVAISEHPEHTFANRGIYAVSPLGKSRLDAVLGHASVALVTAGLLFDQGARWTSGKSEMYSNTPCPDIPGIAGFMSLAAMNGARPLMHGIGAGPLDLSDSKKLVAFMGGFGTVYAARDKITYDLVKACGVSDERVVLSADTAFVAPQPDTSAARKFLAEHELDPAECDLIAISLRNYEGMPPSFTSNVAVTLDTVLGRSARAHVVFCILDSDDATISREVAAQMRHASKTVMYDAHDDVQAMAGMLSLCKTGVSMRYHASLVLMACGKPCVGIGYLPKVNALFDEMGASDALLSMQASADELYAALDLVLSNYETRAAAVVAARANMVERAESGQRLLADALAVSGPKAGFVKRDFLMQDTPEFDRRLMRDIDEARASAAEANRARRDLTRENEALKARIEELETSTTYKVGKALMKVPTTLKDKLGK
jgi:polysaccharide pyruvyl transferase WcaK-like protein